MSMDASRRDQRFAHAIWRFLAIIGSSAVLVACGTPEQVVSNNWDGALSTPPGQEHTPPEALRRGVEGWALLQCVAGEEHQATQCILLVETPQGWGFGEAALRMQDGLRARDVSSYGGTVPKPGEIFYIPVMFCPANDPINCQPRLKQQVIAFNAQNAQVRALIRAGNCTQAQAAADQLGQPHYSSVIAAACTKRAR